MMQVQQVINKVWAAIAPAGRKRRLGVLLAAVAVLAPLCAPLPLLAQAKSGKELYWYDGGVRRSIWVDDNRMADFSSNNRSQAAVVKSMPATKTLSEGQSPLFRDNADEQARTRALPGGVIVRLRQVLPDDQARQYLQQRGLTPVREIGTQTGMWLVDSAPGLDSLNLANQLHEKGEFVSASPNWWQPRALK